MHNARSDLLREAVTEALKNMILVLAAARVLSEGAWEHTWTAVEPLVPKLKAELEPALGM